MPRQSGPKPHFTWKLFDPKQDEGLVPICGTIFKTFQIISKSKSTLATLLSISRSSRRQAAHQLPSDAVGDDLGSLLRLGHHQTRQVRRRKNSEQVAARQIEAANRSIRVEICNQVVIRSSV